MTSALISLMVVAGTLAAPATPHGAVEVQRFALVAGANFGGSDRPELRYAVSDAERFARVLVELGGVPENHAIVLKQPKLRELVDALDELSARVGEARRAAAANGGGRTEVLVYYSGHADEKGLLIGEDRYSYQSLRERLEEIPADVRIAVLDACASGAFTRAKGGRKRPPFLVDESSDMQGHAFLTSSAETESAQESDHIGASYFTYYLISGLRGAADVTGEGKVTLNEAYQFAFNETLGRTVDTTGGPQHPSYDISLTGTGDVVMTDLRQTTATMVLGAELDGRIFVRNARQELVVELFKPYGRTVELGLEPGVYEVRVEREAHALIAHAQIAEGQRVALDANLFTPTKPEPTRRRGDETLRFALSGRNRLELRLGMSTAGGFRPSEGAAWVGSEVGNVTAGFQYTRFLSESLALTLALQAQSVLAGTGVDETGAHVGSQEVIRIPLGVRWNPSRKDFRRKTIKPYLAAGLGPVIGTAAGVSAGPSGTVVGTRTLGALGGSLGAGVDVMLGRSCAVGLSAGYDWMTDFAEPFGGRRNYSGADVTLSVGWLFGKGTASRH
jgi:hypothetical protein